VDDPRSKLSVLRLQRDATLARESGSYNNAVSYLNEAIELHLGTDDYSKANLCEYITPSNPLEILEQIETEFVIYEPFVHLKVAKIQRSYRKHSRLVLGLVLGLELGY
jgi:hypothetical protein